MTTFTKSKLFLVACVLGIILADLWHDVHWLYYLTPFLLFVVYLAFGVTTLGANLFTKSYTNPENKTAQVALTFDDGPNENTKQVLQVLKKHDAKATFFCIGQKIEKYPEILKRIVDDGHSVGNHSYSHSNYFPLFSRKKIKHEIQRTTSLIEEITELKCHLFRPPFGVINPKVAAGAEATDHNIIGWNLRTFDTSRNYKKVIKQVKKKLRAGSVVLLHDDRSNTAKVLDEILLYGKSKGFTFVTVEEIFEFEK